MIRKGEDQEMNYIHDPVLTQNSEMQLNYNYTK